MPTDQRRSKPVKGRVDAFSLLALVVAVGVVLVGDVSAAGVVFSGVVFSSLDGDVPVVGVVAGVVDGVVFGVGTVWL